MNLSEAAKKVEELHNKMPGKNWNANQRFNDLVEEVGELANAIQVEEGAKSRKRLKADLVDSICDVIYAVFLISSYYKVNLDAEFQKALDLTTRRLKEGEFDHV